jgi:hypothetical protein
VVVPGGGAQDILFYPSDIPETHSIVPSTELFCASELRQCFTEVVAAATAKWRGGDDNLAAVDIPTLQLQQSQLFSTCRGGRSGR